MATLLQSVTELQRREEEYKSGNSWKCGKSPTGAHHWIGGREEPIHLGYLMCKYCYEEKNKEKLKEDTMAKVEKKQKEKQAKAAEATVATESNGNGAKAAEEAMTLAMNLVGTTEEKLTTARLALARAEGEEASDNVKAVWEHKVKHLEQLNKEEEAAMGKTADKAVKGKVVKGKAPVKAAKKAGKVAEAKAKVEKAMVGQKAEKAVKVAVVKAAKPPKVEKPKKEGIECLCGCGVTTNPGREFKAGHDARFKGMVKKYLRKEVKLTDLPERVQAVIKANHPAVIKVRGEEKGEEKGE